MRGQGAAGQHLAYDRDALRKNYTRLNFESIASVVIIILSLQTVLLIILILQKGKKSVPYRLLSLILFFFLLALLNFGNFNLMVAWGYTDWIPYLQLELIYGLGPSLYLYTKSLTDKSYRFQRHDWLHFMLPLLEFLYYRTSLFRRGAISLSANVETSENLFYQVVQWGGIISLTIYLSIAFYLLIEYKRWLGDHFSNLENRALLWLEKPLMIYLSFCVIWIPIRIIDILFFEEALRSYYFNLGFVSLATITCWIGFKGYLTTHINTVGFLKNQKTNPTHDFTASDLESTASTLQQLMLEEKYYLDHDLSLSSFAKKTGYPQKKISIALNNSLQLSFHEFVNNYRVEAFKQNLQNKKFAHLSLLGIALESGFGSKSSFNLVFKSSTGMTPQRYKQQFVDNKS